MSLRTVRYAVWALVVLVVATVAGVLVGQRFLGSDLGMASLGKIGGPFELVGVDGETVTSEALFKKPTALFFGFTHCPEVCPTTLFEAGGWLDALGEEADKLNVVFITIDPERDTPALLKQYMSAFDPRLIALTGSPDEIAEVADDYRVYVNKVELADGDYTMEHSASVLMFDEEGTFHGTAALGEPKDDVVAKLRRLVEGD